MPRKTIARRYLDALAAKKRVNKFLRPDTATFVDGSRIVQFSDGSYVWIHAAKSTIHEAASLEDARRKVSESIGDFS